MPSKRNEKFTAENDFNTPELFIIKNVNGKHKMKMFTISKQICCPGDRNGRFPTAPKFRRHFLEASSAGTAY
jgi:hypothetical protein